MVIDTNVLVYAADDDAAPEQEHCRGFLERCRDDSLPWYLTWGVVYEFLRIVTHPRVFRHPRSVNEAWAFLVVLMHEHGVRRIATRDADFHRFSSIEVIDPLDAR